MSRAENMEINKTSNKKTDVKTDAKAADETVSGICIDAAVDGVNDIIILTPESPQWPKTLNNLMNPPKVLFAKGNLDLLSKPAVAIVGTRDCTRYGLQVAENFGKQLGKMGIVTISGLAYGIDKAAHTGAFPNTIAVLGNGVNVYFPAFNRKLQDDIAANGGLLLSEYEPNTVSTRYYFPQRNRIIAALAQAVIVVEADLKSGALITKNYALELGLDVFAVPGPITSHASRGTNRIIKDAQCAIITDIQDVLDCFGLTVKDEKAKSVTQISFEAKTIIDLLRPGELHFDDLITATRLRPQNLTTLLTNMELDGLIEKLAGNMYVSKLENSVTAKTK